MKRILSCAAFILLVINITGQSAESEKKTYPLKASGNIQLTNNGISLFPNLSLGKPATIINLNLSKYNFALEPELRWGLNGDPWSFIFWVRYRFNKNKFQLRLGAHPSYVFKEQKVGIDNGLNNRLISTAYFAAEIAPGWQFNKKFGFGLHYLHAEARDNYGAQSNNFIALQPRFTNIYAGARYYFNFYPQVFYLQIDANDGFYASQTLTFNKVNFPLYFSGVTTYALKTTIPGDRFVWSLGINLKF